MIAFVIAVGITTWNGMIMSFTNLSTTYNTAFEQESMASFTIQTANPSGTGDDAWIDYTNLTSFINEYNAKHNNEIAKFELRIIYDLDLSIRGNRQNGRIIGIKTTDSNGNLRSKPNVNGFRLLTGNGFDDTSSYRNVTLLEAHLADYWKLKLPLDVPKPEFGNERFYFTRMPASAPESGCKTHKSLPPGPAASTMPSETPKRIFRGARLATTTVSLPSSSSGA